MTGDFLFRGCNTSHPASFRPCFAKWMLAQTFLFCVMETGKVKPLCLRRSSSPQLHFADWLIPILSLKLLHNELGLKVICYSWQTTTRPSSTTALLWASPKQEMAGNCALLCCVQRQLGPSATKTPGALVVGLVTVGRMMQQMMVGQGASSGEAFVSESWR